MNAVSKGHKEIVELLLKQKGIDINIQDILNLKHSHDSNLTFFHIISNLNDLWNLTVTFNETALICAATKGKTEIVELLLRQEDIDINHQDIINQKTFIKFKPNFFHYIEKLNDLWNLIQTFNKTALNHAVERYREETVEVLLRHKGIDINIKDVLNLKISYDLNLSFSITFRF